MSYNFSFQCGLSSVPDLALHVLSGKTALKILRFLSFSNIAQEVMNYHEFANENSFYESLPAENFSIA